MVFHENLTYYIRVVQCLYQFCKFYLRNLLQSYQNLLMMYDYKKVRWLKKLLSGRLNGGFIKVSFKFDIIKT